MALLDGYGNLTKLRWTDTAFLEIQGDKITLILKRSGRTLREYNVKDPMQILRALADCSGLELGKQIAGNNTIIARFRRGLRIKDRLRIHKKHKKNERRRI